MLISSDGYIHVAYVGQTARQPRDWIASVDCSATVQTQRNITTTVTSSVVIKAFLKRRVALFRLAAKV